MRAPILISVLSVICGTATACDVDSTPDEELETICGELLCGPAGKADELSGTVEVLDTAVQWDLVLDNGTRTTQRAGHVRVRFFGPELPLASGGQLAPDTPSVLQPALLELTVPELENPDRLQSLSFYAMLQSWDDGETYAIEPLDGQGALVSTTAGDAVERFNAVYDFETKTGTHTSRVEASLAFSAIRFARDASGDLDVEYISMAFAEPHGDTTADHKATTGRRASAQPISPLDAAIANDRAVVEEVNGSIDVSFGVRQGTVTVLEAKTLREAALQAADQSLLAETTVAIFERGGLFVTAGLEWPSGGNVRMAVTGHYEPQIDFGPVDANGPILLVDHGLSHFLLGIADLSAGPGNVELSHFR